VIDGYAHKLPVLLARVLAKLAAPSLAADRFETQRELQRIEYANFFKSEPHRLAAYAASHLLEMSRWHLLEYVQSISSSRCSHAALEAFARHALLGQVHLTALCHGSVTPADATKLIEDAARALGGEPLAPSQVPAQRLLQLPAAVEVHLRLHASLCGELERSLINQAETNSAVEFTLQAGVQAGTDGRLRSMRVELLSQILQLPAHEQLRTVEQLGYRVQLGMRLDLGVVGLRVVIQGEQPPHHFDDRIEAFLATVPALLRSLEDSEFENHREALIEARLEAPTTLKQESDKHWSEISAGTCDFGRDAADVECIRGLTREGLLAYWEDTFAADAPQRRKLLACAYAAHLALPPPSSVVSTVSKAPIVCVDGLEAAIEFKRTLAAFAPPQRADQ
jgi:secreted Zn-dependent insulinase-like peptidase